MKRWFRFWPPMLDAAGLLLLVVVAAAWPVGYWRGDALVWLRGDGRSFALAGGNGQWVGLMSSRALTTEQPPQLMHLHLQPDQLKEAVTFLSDNSTRPPMLFGFHWLTSVLPFDSNGVTIYSVGFPQWLTSIPAAWALLSRATSTVRYRRRRRRGLCPVCGYDLRESTSRCPECGRLLSTEPQTE